MPRAVNYLLAAIALWCATSIYAHQNSTAYLFIDDQGSALKGRWEIPVRDLEFAVGLDADHDGDVTWGEIRQQLPAIRDYAFSRLALHAANVKIPVSFEDAQVNQRPTGVTLVLRWAAAPPQGTALNIEYGFGFDFDGGHQCIVAAGDRTSIFTKERRTFDLREAEVERGLGQFVRVGVFHIFEGIDHICFLLALMLPAVWKRTAAGWEAVTSFRTALISIGKIVTAFTVAHSITLSLAALRIVVLPSALVESIIAFSVVVAALNNLWPLWTDKSWMVAFGFGLVHGFGFASALSDLPTGAGALILSLGGFNLGVEVGQLCIVLVFLPVAFLLRESWFYRWCAVRAGSAGIAGVAAIWLVERAFRITVF